MIVLATIFCLQVLLALACHWSVHVMAFVTCSNVITPHEATIAKFVPTANNGSAELVRIRKSAKTGDIWCIFQKLKYIWSDEEGVFKGLEFPTSETFSTYLNAKGFEDEESLAERRRVFGDNKYVELPKCHRF